MSHHLSDPANRHRRRFIGQVAAGASLLAAGCMTSNSTNRPQSADSADLILHNGRIATLDPAKPSVAAVAIQDGLFSVVGSDAEVMAQRGVGEGLFCHSRR
jgi:hypothetical protein